MKQQKGKPPNPLPNDKILNWFKVKAFTIGKVYVIEKLLFVFGRVGKVGKLPAFSPFPIVFSKGSFFRVVKSRDYVGKSFFNCLFLWSIRIICS